MLSMLFFQVLMPYGLASTRVSEEYTVSIFRSKFSPEVGDNIFLGNVSIYPQGHTTLKSVSPTPTSSPPRELIISIHSAVRVNRSY